MQTKTASAESIRAAPASRTLIGQGMGSACGHLRRRLGARQPLVAADAHGDRHRRATGRRVEPAAASLEGDWGGGVIPTDRFLDRRFAPRGAPYGATRKARLTARRPASERL